MTNDEEKHDESLIEEILPFEGGGSFPVQYEVVVGEASYDVRYRGSWLTIERNDEQVFEQRLDREDEQDGEWSEEETTVYLYLISKAIEQGDFGSLTLPDKKDVSAHPLYRPGPLPVYVFLNCRKKHKHDYTHCSTVSVSAMELAKMRKEAGAKATIPQRIARTVRGLFR